MAINPPSDIVLGVAQAADPVRRQAAAERLLRLAANQPVGAAAEADEEAPAAEAGSAAPPSAASIGEWRTATEPSGQRRSVAAVAARPAPPQRQAFVEFEAMVLQSFVQSMLPKDAASVFGRGTAGEIWKSMLAEQIAQEIAKGGGIGIAERVARGGAPARTAAPVASYLSTLRPADIARDAQRAAQASAGVRSTEGDDPT